LKKVHAGLVEAINLQKLHPSRGCSGGGVPKKKETGEGSHLLSAIQSKDRQEFRRTFIKFIPVNASYHLIIEIL